MCEGLSEVAARLKAEAKLIGPSIAGCCHIKYTCTINQGPIHT
jgi:hypothetical protein